jgi:parallel beta-helix repeat protein
LDGGGTGATNASGATGLKFKGLTFQRLGKGGMYFNGGSSSPVIRWNNFYNCQDMCVSGVINNGVIDSNTFDGNGPGNTTGTNGITSAAVNLWYGSSGNQVTHNLIQNCQAAGIVFSDGPSDPPINNNIIDRNIVRNVDTNTTDSGAIYMMDRSHSSVGNQITNNVISGNGGSTYLTNWTKAIYIDDLMSNVTVSGNICRNCGEYGIQIHAGDHITVVNNIFDLSSSGTVLGLYQNNTLYTDYGMTGNVFQRNIIYSSGSTPSPLWQVGIGPSDALPADSTNLYYSASGAAISNSGQIVDTNPSYTNPQFTNPAAGDYSMPSTSPAYSLIQFQKLPVDQGPVPYTP